MKSLKTHFNKSVLAAKFSALVLAASLLASCASPQAPGTSAAIDETGKSSEIAAVTTTVAAPTVTPTPAGVLDPKTSNLRGEKVEDTKKAARPIAVMLDNHPAARYQAGLKDADLVFEMPVEGSFTRYMAIFQSKFPEIVGPVRSSREQFLDRMLEFNPVYMHFGGSVPASERIAREGYETIDGMTVGSEYYRKNDTGKEAPHNAYTNLVEVQDYIKNKGWKQEADFVNYYFNATPSAPKGKPANEVVIDINSSNQTSYTYLPDKQLYERYKDGQKDLDENDNSAVEVTNIIIQNAKYYVYEATWQKVEQITEGTGNYASMGQIVPITWKKSDVNSLTRYYTKDGKELVLNPGQTWIHIVNIGVEPSVQ